MRGGREPGELHPSRHSGPIPPFKKAKTETGRAGMGLHDGVPCGQPSCPPRQIAEGMNLRRQNKGGELSRVNFFVYRGTTAMRPGGGEDEVQIQGARASGRGGVHFVRRSVTEPAERRRCASDLPPPCPLTRSTASCYKIIKSGEAQSGALSAVQDRD
jgi:hypothetical protein